MGHPLVIVSDHKSLSYVLSSPVQTVPLSRWVLYKQEFNPLIQYCPEAENIVANVLSCYPLPSKLVIGPQRDHDIITFLPKFISEFKLLRQYLRRIGEDHKQDPWCVKIIVNLGRVNHAIPNDCHLKWFLLNKEILFKEGDNPGSSHAFRTGRWFH